MLTPKEGGPCSLAYWRRCFGGLATFDFNVLRLVPYRPRILTALIGHLIVSWLKVGGKTRKHPDNISMMLEHSSFPCFFLPLLVPCCPASGVHFCIFLCFATSLRKWQGVLGREFCCAFFFPWALGPSFCCAVVGACLFVVFSFLIGSSDFSYVLYTLHWRVCMRSFQFRYLL